jgi:hypothetical protein
MTHQSTPLTPRARALVRPYWNGGSALLAQDAIIIETQAIDAERERLRRELGDRLGHDLRALATDAESSLHCIWPSMFLRVLDLLDWEDTA